jgi:hypothetical protein
MQYFHRSNPAERYIQQILGSKGTKNKGISGQRNVNACTAASGGLRVCVGSFCLRRDTKCGGTHSKMPRPFYASLLVIFPGMAMKQNKSSDARITSQPTRTTNPSRPVFGFWADRPSFQLALPFQFRVMQAAGVAKCPSTIWTASPFGCVYSVAAVASTGRGSALVNLSVVCLLKP